MTHKFEIGNDCKSYPDAKLAEVCAEEAIKHIIDYPEVQYLICTTPEGRFTPVFFGEHAREESDILNNHLNFIVLP